jgi:uncharacterized protein YndB with AHSA1/START domain
MAISENVTVPLSAEAAFDLFINRFDEWWPREYTWSNDVLEEIAIEPRVGGMCFERGPHGFRIDWGRVLVFDPQERVEFTWQISPRREPVPDPERASRVSVVFADTGEANSEISLRHDGFEAHGEGAAEYESALSNDAGWPYILSQFEAAARR